MAGPFLIHSFESLVLDYCVALPEQSARIVRP